MSPLSLIGATASLGVVIGSLLVLEDTVVEFLLMTAAVCLGLGIACVSAAVIKATSARPTRPGRVQ